MAVNTRYTLLITAARRQITLGSGLQRRKRIRLAAPVFLGGLSQHVQRLPLEPVALIDDHVGGPDGHG